MQRVADAGVGVVGTEAKRQAGSQGAAPPRTTGAAAAAAATKTSAGFVRETAARRDLNIAKAQWESKYLPSLEHACVGFDAMTVLVQYLVNEVSAFFSNIQFIENTTKANSCTHFYFNFLFIFGFIFLR